MKDGDGAKGSSRGRISSVNPPDPDQDLLDDIDDMFDDGNGVLAGLKDTARQTITNMVVAFQDADNARSKTVYQRRLARVSKDKDGAKNANAAIVKMRESLITIVKDLIEGLLEHPEFAREANNWLSWPMNLRPILKKQLKMRGLDVSEYIAQAEEIEEERRRLAEQSSAADSDAEGPAGLAVAAREAQ